MGNTQATAGSNCPSAGTADKNFISEKAKTEGHEETELEESGPDFGSDTDLSHLFHADDVHIIASDLRECKETVYDCCYNKLYRVLDNMNYETRNQPISFFRFCDMMKSLDLSEADLMQVFNLLDYEGHGSFEVVPVLQALRKNKKIMQNDDLNVVLKRFEDCLWMPGFVDAHIDQKDSSRQRGLSILDYLLRNRFSGSAVNCSAIEIFEDACMLRERIVKSMLKSLEFPTSISAQTKPVHKDSVSEDHLLPKEVKTQELQQDKVHSGEALVLWYIQLVTTTARACFAVAPEVLSTALTHTRTMVSQLLPLSLCHDSGDRPSFLNEDCLREISSLIQPFPENAELLDLSLSFHLACGSLSQILQCLTALNVSTVQIDCSSLVSNIDRVRKKLLQRSTRYLKMDLLGCDAEGIANQDPHSVLEANWKKSAFSTKPGETKVNFVFECSDWAEFTKIKIKVASEKSAPSHGCIFVLAEWHADSDSSLTKELEKFALYDSWTESDYKSQISKRSTGRSCITNEPVTCFTTKDRDEVDVMLDNPVIGKFVVVKFLEPRETGVDHLEIVGIKFYGIPVTASFGLMEQQMLTAEPLESNQLAIQAVLRFLLRVFFSQAKKKRAVPRDNYHFGHVLHATVDQKTGIVACEAQSSDFQRSFLVAKMPFSKDCPCFEIEIVTWGSICVGAVPVNFNVLGGHPPGLTTGSYGYKATDGEIFVDANRHSESKKNPCKTGDRMGCGVEFKGEMIKTVYFTKNGERISATAIAHPTNDLFPAVEMRFSLGSVRLLSKDPWRFADKQPAEKMLVALGSDFINSHHIDLSNVTIEMLWKTYRKFPKRINQGLILQLIHSMLPQLKPGSNDVEKSSQIFYHLCCLLEHKYKRKEDNIIARSVKDIIKDGIDLFFPWKEARPKMFFDLVQDSSELPLTGTKQVLFQALYQYFSTVDLNALMPLPSPSSQLPQDFNSSNLCTIMEQLFSSSFRDSLSLLLLTPETSMVNRRSVSLGDKTLSGRKKSEHLFHLPKLFNQLQVHLFAWVSQKFSKSPEATDDVDRLEKFVIHYCCQLIAPKAEHFLTRMKMLKDSDLKVILPQLDTSFLATALRELVLLLCELSTKLSSWHKVKLLESLKPVLMTIRKLLFKVPDLLDENKGGKLMEEVLRTWEVDSLLTDEPASDSMFSNAVSVICFYKIDKTFSCTEATHFEVEFDERCKTANAYEYLDFSDSNGNRRFFRGIVGNSRWPRTARFEGTSAIKYYYVGSTTSFRPTEGYNFKVKAMQTKVSDFHWLYDLYLSFCRLFGRISASVLDKTPVVPNSATSQGQLEVQMYRSELWTTLFCGGLVAMKLETADQSDVATFLNAVAEFNSEKAKAFINRCKSHHNGNHSIGGEEIDRVIASVFAALLWHTQSLRHDVNIYLRNEFDGKISDGIHEAYSAAEDLRLFLAEQRQTMRKELEEQRERGEEDKAKGKEAAVDVVHLVEEKSKFLLQFAGLSRVALKPEEVKKKFETRRSSQQSINRRLSHEPSVDLSISAESNYPSFRLVLDFLQDIAWTKDKVEDLLQKRYKNSESLWKTYSFMSEFFRTISSELLENDMSCTVFIQELLASQNKFGRHYADGIDGCGLGMETNVRSSYYGLMRLLVTLLRKDMTDPTNKSKPVRSEVLTTCVLHLLDIDWQAYDLPFVVELRLPELYFTLAKVHQIKKITIKDPMNGYFHLHSWMLFSSVALSMHDFLMSKASDETLQKVDESYFLSARHLYSMCLNGAVEYLVSESSTDEMDSDESISSSAEATASQTNGSALIKGGLVPQIIGFITALLPSNNLIPAAREVTDVLSAYKFLTTLFDIARAKKVHDVVTRHMALVLLGKLLQQMNISCEVSESLISAESGEMMTVDPKAVNFVQGLFSFGADCLKRHELGLAKSSSQVLNGLQTNPTWTQLLTHQFSATVDLLHSMLTVGTLVTHVEKDNEVIRSVVRCKESDGAMCTIVELISRKKKRMKDTLLDVVANKKSFLTENQVSQFVKLIIDVVNQKVIPGLAVDSHSLWQLALVIKASLQSVHNSQSKDNLYLYENSFLQCLSHLASLGTGLSKSLLLRDLEVLSLELNKRSQTEPDLIAEPEAVATTTGDDVAADNNDNYDHDDDDNDDDLDHDHWRMASPSSSEDWDYCVTQHTAGSEMRSTNMEPDATDEIMNTTMSGSDPGGIGGQDTPPHADHWRGASSSSSEDWNSPMTQNTAGSEMRSTNMEPDATDEIRNTIMRGGDPGGRGGQDTPPHADHWRMTSASSCDDGYYRGTMYTAGPEMRSTNMEPDATDEIMNTTMSGSDPGGIGEQDTPPHADHWRGASSSSCDDWNSPMTQNTAGSEMRSTNMEPDATDEIRNTIMRGGDPGGRGGQDTPPHADHWRMTSASSCDDGYYRGTMYTAEPEMRSTNMEPDATDEIRNTIMSGSDPGGIVGQDTPPHADHWRGASSSSSEDWNSPMTQNTAGSEMRSTNMEPGATDEIMNTIPREVLYVKKTRGQTTQKKGEIDTGIRIGQYISDLLHAEIEIEECIKEWNPEKPCLISTSGDEDEKMVRKQKEKSSGLVEKLLRSKEKGLLTKVNRALAILYARKLLMALLSECPDDKAVKFDITSIFFILPLLVDPGANGTLEKLIAKVVKLCHLNDVVSIAVTSSFFVAATKAQVVTVSKQLPSPLLSMTNEDAGSSSLNFMNEVYIPGATALKVELDESFCGHCDVELVFSSSPDLTKNRQCFSGRSSENWEEFTIKGDHLYCTLSGPDVTLLSSSYQFKVTGTVSFSDHFDVGYLALDAIFDKPESARLLPVGRLWKLLVGMANRSVKTKRLKAIRLLLKLVSLQTKIRGCKELSMDLSLLKGLYQMYQKMMEVTKDSAEVQPALVLALTELFYKAQNVAKEWNADPSFMTTVEADVSVPEVVAHLDLF